MPDNNSESADAVVPLKDLAVEKAGALHPKDSVETAGDRMREHAANAWPVAQDRKLVGMVGSENPDWEAGGHGHDPKTLQVSAIMSKEVVFCFEDEDCNRAREVMEQRGLDYLPVVDRDMRIVGVFSREEIQERASRPTTTAAAATLNEP